MAAMHWPCCMQYDRPSEFPSSSPLPTHPANQPIHLHHHHHPHRALLPYGCWQCRCLRYGHCMCNHVPSHNPAAPTIIIPQPPTQGADILGPLLVAVPGVGGGDGGDGNAGKGDGVDGEDVYRPPTGQAPYGKRARW